MAQPFASRRALRDLVPATLATGAAGLVVTLLVGATTQGIRPAMLPSGDPAALTHEVARGGTVATDDITVRVRPGRPGPLGVVSFLDLVPTGPSAESAPAVRGVFFESRAAAPASGVEAAASTPIPAPVPPAPAPAPTPAADAPAAATPRPGPSPRPKPASKAPKAKTSELTATGSPGRVSLDAPSSDADEADDADEAKPKPGASPNGPPDHAPAYGHRRR